MNDSLPPLSFAKEVQPSRVADIKEAYDIANRIVLTPQEVSLGDLAISDAGAISGEKERKITRYGFESFCSILGIPKPFANHIPTDLLLTNIRRLIKEKASQTVVLLLRPTGTIASIVKTPYDDPPYLDVLGTVIGEHPIRYIDIGERLLTVCLTFEEVSVQGIDAKDLLFVGSFLYHSLVKQTRTHISAGFFRTQCENSFIAPFLGKVRAQYQKEADIRLLQLASQVECFDDALLSQLRKQFKKLPERLLLETEAATIWRSLSRVLHEQAADSLLGYSEDERKIILDHVKELNFYNRQRRLKMEEEDEGNFTALKVYDILNNITSHAKDLHEVDKMQLERLGGQLLCRFLS